MQLREYITDIDKLNRYIDDGIVEVRAHNTLPLHILCYGRRATYDNIWDDVTTKCRGLIINSATTIVARPFEKFFNFAHAGRPETSLDELLKEKFDPFVTDKLDGSMGTYWEYDGHYGVATKGSFHSEQAEWATKWLHEHYAKNDWAARWMHPWTPVFEIINQSIQHHVCHYEPKEDNTLRLIGMVNRVSGEEMHGVALEHEGQKNGIGVVRQYHCRLESFSYGLMGLIECLEAAVRPGKEGFVMSWARSGAPSRKVKIKHAEFLKLQKIAHHTTPKVVFDYCKNGDYDEINEVTKLASPWLASQVKEWVTNYVTAHDRIVSDARYTVSLAVLECTTRKDLAAFFLREEHKPLSAVCFNLLDEKDYHKTAWDLVEPLVKQQKFSEVEAEG